MRKLSDEAKEGQALRVALDPEAMRAAETAIFRMCGGGLLGASAVDQPSSFYIDSRVGRLPYGRRAIEQAVGILARAREIAGIPEPYEKGGYKNLVNLGIF